MDDIIGHVFNGAISLNLLELIEDWNGRSVGDMEEVYAVFCDDAAFTSELTGCLNNPTYQVGATWLLKRYFEEGHSLSPSEVKKVYGTAQKLGHWMSKLLVLQSVPYLPIRTTDIKSAEPFIRKCLEDDNKMVRAWAYNGFYELSLQHPSYQKEARELLDRGMKDDAGSVQARIRNILKTGF
jgi:hypothetical protein